ncbi:hypothetical protein [Alysiella crassa]|uniref:AlwI restriction endonuclease n=1 Tax=Alysiella crassa TaxID=153491 RepID=A0A376BSU8_9NEIS|nr:hypothetical protein [Alysiella crassa]UOP07914.1 restriction endonuclease [Alysiella crassa]SSY79969.1 Uncharacterised protein [Alysiella crassa]
MKTERSGWVIDKGLQNFNTLCELAGILKVNSDISVDDKAKLSEILENKGIYRRRSSGKSLDATTHKIKVLSFYMFGYRDIYGQNKQKFLFSPLGNLFLKHLENDEYIKKIFITMLWAMPFPHPYIDTNESIQLYPMRLLFQLLSDERLGNKLYSFEYVCLISFIKQINQKSYDDLVQELLTLRKLSATEISQKLTTKGRHDHDYVNAAHEWESYLSAALDSVGVLQKTEGSVICRLKHGNTETYRKVTYSEIIIPEQLRPFVQKLQNAYPFTEKPLKSNDPERLKIDVIKEIYSFYPKELLEEIGELEDDTAYELLQLPKLIEQYADNNDGLEAYLFEDVLEMGFNLFYNVEAKKIGGAGNTDLECLYITKKKKFAVEAKSTKNKLSSINAGRLEEHQNKIQADYTIVVTPRYVPAVLSDIRKRPIVIIRANTFAEFLYNCLINRTHLPEIDFKYFDEIIVNHLGKDISMEISNLTIGQFASNTTMEVHSS